jgi:hypothetical protein
MFEDYISQLPEERRVPFSKIIELLENNLPEGFEAQTQYSMPSFVVPHSVFPAGYHCNPKEPLPFIVWLPKRISLHCITWVCTPNPNCCNGSQKPILITASTN